jgi:hypothetical protein
VGALREAQEAAFTDAGYRAPVVFEVVPSAAATRLPLPGSVRSDPDSVRSEEEAS